MRRVLTKKFFDRPVLDVAEDLLGKYIVCRIGKKDIALQITEVEAYNGSEDRACHAHKGKTPRTEVMFGEAGRFYVYLCYGMYWMLNIIADKEGYPAAVLIRGAIIPRKSAYSPRESASREAAIDGPGKLTKALKIDKKLNCKKADKASGLWFEDRGVKIIKKDIKRTPRIGVHYAGTWAKKPYRFLLEKK